MTDYRDYWVVMIGDLYLCGLGQTYDGSVGHVISKLKERAMRFWSLSDAQSAARFLGGTVYKV